MDQTRLIVWLGCTVLLALAGLPGDAPAAELLEREGRFIRLTTDLDSADEADTLVTSFDAAVGQWSEFWNLPDDALATWKVDACVIRNKAEFNRRGLIPPRVPDFPFGYALGNKVWVLAQQSEYYTRHLLLHEGVHSLAFQHFGGAGPTWYREGTAELLATHRGQSTGLRINQIPATRDEVPYWGRFKRMKQLRDQSAVPTLDAVMRYQPDLRGDVGVYGWSWAAAMMLHAYPDSRNAFLDAAGIGRDDGPGFNRQLHQKLSKQWPALAARWRLHGHDLDYGFRWSRERVDLATSDPVWDGRPLRTQVAADRGWQSIGVRIARRRRIQLTPAGQITLATTSKPWTSGPAGITFRYHRGRPLGQLLACVLPNAFDPQSRLLPPLNVRPIEQTTTLEIPQYSWLLMRVNDGVGELGDNTGSFEVTITRGD
jgi:hypothetical protein